MKLLICLLGLQIGFLAIGRENTTLQQDTILAKHYRADEIDQLATIVNFFDAHVVSTCQNSDDIKVCYQQYFDHLSDSFDIAVPFKDQADLYLKSLSKEVFNSIWTYSPGRAQLADGTIQWYNAIDYHPEGAYRKFLKDVSEAEPYFAKYVEPIESSGSIAQPDGFLYDPSGLDFTNVRHRLILAVHFLTYNDQIATQPR